jgi:alpha-glucosidase
MPEKTWWKHGTIYQIYPRSFQDTNGDGVGDLEGIRQRLDYLSWLGIHAFWISPIFPSPMADFGYDVSDYCDINPLFGSLADFDRLLADAHARGLKVILDFVPNHTSSEHPWFRESRSSRTNPKRDWYIWRDGKPDGSPPNNWVSNFGGPAWAYDEATGQWYLHQFLREQPDLNWRNPAVREAMYAALRFWLDRGVDGFRMDVLWLCVKDAELRDNPPNPNYQPGQPEINSLTQVYNGDQPEVHEVIAEMQQIFDSYGDRVTIGEIYLPLERLVTYYGQELKGTNLPFNFQMIFAPWTARSIAALIEDYEAALPQGGWPNWVLGNHDQARIAARIGAAQARVAAILLLTLRGTPTLYYGDELGIGHVDIPPDAAQDPWGKNEPGLGVSRDPERTPFQWDASANAGFSRAKPWLPLAADYAQNNAETLRQDPHSILSLYRELLELRRRHFALSVGTFRIIPSADDILLYERSYGDERFLIALNFSHEDRPLPDLGLSNDAKIVVSTVPTGTAELTRLRADEGLIVQVAD